LETVDSRVALESVMSLTDIFISLWWLIFPIMGFAFGGFAMFARHRQNQKALDILKTYVEQGRDPPPEILRAVYGQNDSNPPSGVGPGPSHDPAWGGGPWSGGPWGNGAWGGGGWGWRAYRWGPFWAWRRAIIFICLATGFGVAAWYEGGRSAEGLVITAIIMGVLAVGAVLTAIMQSMWRPK
jgi:hypothetical protein